MFSFFSFNHSQRAHSPVLRTAMLWTHTLLLQENDAIIQFCGPFSAFLLSSWLGLNRTWKDNQRSFYEEASKNEWELEGSSWICLWQQWKEHRSVPDAFLTSLNSPLFFFSLPSSELGECVLLVQSHCIMGGLERPRGCDIIKPICERPFNRVYACMCMWCHSVAPAPFIFVWPQARKTEFWHQRHRPQPTLQVLRFHSFFPLVPPLSLCLCRHGCLLTVSIPTPFHRTILRVWLLQL